jgi:hypothetical protein
LEGLDECRRNRALARRPVVTPKGVTFRHPTTTEIYNRLQQIAEQQKLGLFKPDQEKDQLTMAIGTPEHTGCVRGLSSTTGRAKGFEKDIASYMKCDRYKQALLTEAKVKEIAVHFVELLQSTQRDSVACAAESGTVPNPSSVGSTAMERFPVDDMTSRWIHLASLSSHMGGTVTRFVKLQLGWQCQAACFIVHQFHPNTPRYKW